MKNNVKVNLNSGKEINQRLTSVDAFRGFTMLWLISGGDFIKSFYSVWPNPFTKVLAENMDHIGWKGFHFEDLIFPLFLFVVGLLIPMLISRRIAKGATHKDLYLQLVKRTLVLFVLGLVVYRVLNFDWATQRYSSVLLRIGICYSIACILVIHTNWKVQLYVVLAILIGYWAAVMFIPVPGYGAGVLTPEGCLNTWLDQNIIPGRLAPGPYDYQGVLSTFTALASTLIGVLAGHWLQSNRTGNQKTIGFIIAGLIALTAGWVWGQFFFISRYVWTSSFVLFAAGWSLLLWALFYWIIDVKGYKKWAFFLVVIGVNSITIWVGQEFIDFKFTTDFLFMGFSRYFGIIQPIIIALCLLITKWLLLWGLYRQKIFIKA
jgi:predicted acyltransferase